MFNKVISENSNLNALCSQPQNQMWQNILDDMDGSKRKRHSKGKNKKRSTKETRCLQDDLFRLSYCLGTMQAKNEMLESMMRLSLAAGKRTLRTDVLEVGFQILDDGKS